MTIQVPCARVRYNSRIARMLCMSKSLQIGVNRYMCNIMNVLCRKLRFVAAFGRIGIVTTRLTSLCLISLTPNFSWVGIAPGELQPLQRFSPATTRTGLVEKTAEAVGVRAGQHPPN
jgi:hypothetical protein